jgi:formylglycine-generating enzyme required for sulfatase activity
MLVAVVSSSSIDAQTSISADGVIESKSGGFKFPDGTIQDTAAGVGDLCPTLDPSDEMILVGTVCIDKYEASIWDAPVGGSQIIGATATDYCNPNGQDCNDIYARSVAGVEPADNITWFQALAALINSGKRLPTSAEWQGAVQGTPDPGISPESEDCHVGSSPATAEVTGERADCVSRWGHHDMVGNLWEWVADWGEIAAGCEFWPAGFGDDFACIGVGDGDPVDHRVGVLMRGGRFENVGAAGPFAAISIDPSMALATVGFRGAR